MHEWRSAFEKVRFSGERTVPPTSVLAPNGGALLRHLAQSELAISSVVTPSLAASVAAALDRLWVPLDSVHAFVFASPYIQAYCGWMSEDRCVLRFSSALVDLLTSAEFEFVVGHEIGHFLLGHVSWQDETDTLEDLLCRRAREVSVDRIGLLACASLPAALAAMMKLASGLSDRHVRFDVARFMAQLEHAGPSMSQAHSSHPSVLVRARALLWFSLLETSRDRLSSLDARQLRKVDAAISRDMQRLNDAPVVEQIASLENDAALWAVVHQIVVSGGFTRPQQSRFAEAFGADALSRVTRLLSDVPAEELRTTTATRLNDAVTRFRAASPRRASEADERIAALAARVVYA